jgi:hypothetical protein
MLYLLLTNRDIPDIARKSAVLLSHSRYLGGSSGALSAKSMVSFDVPAN